MRAVLSVFLFAVSANAQSPSSATTQILVNSITACTQAAMPLMGNCAGQQGLVSTTTGQLDLLRFCGSPCMGTMNRYYQSVSNCIQNVRPQLVTSLTKDAVANASSMADSLLLGYKLLPKTFGFMCVRNEVGEFCMPKYQQLPIDMQASGSANLTSICNAYDNLGCCVRAMDDYYQDILPGSRFTDSLIRICPSLATFAPPTCLLYGQTAEALSVVIPLIGLNCAAYAAKDVNFQHQLQAALKNDLTDNGLSFNYTVLKNISQVNGVCSVTLIVRAGTDNETRALQNAAFAADTAELTQSNQVLATAPDMTTTGGNITMGPANVTEVTISGQALRDASGAVLVAPGILSVLAFLVAWIIQ